MSDSVATWVEAIVFESPDLVSSSVHSSLDVYKRITVMLNSFLLSLGIDSFLDRIESEPTELEEPSITSISLLVLSEPPIGSCESLSIILANRLLRKSEPK